MNQLARDVRSGLRLMVRYPTLSVAAVLTLGLGIGLGTTVFGVVNGAMFKGLPFADADRIVALVATNPSQRQPRLPISSRDLAVWRERQTVFDPIGAYAFAPINLATEQGEPERFSGGQLTVAAFAALGVQPMLGRGFRDGDDLPAGEPVILLGERLWRDRYGAEPGVVGTAIRVNGASRVVIGVMPERFGFPVREQLWMPLVIESPSAADGQGPRYQVIARLKSDVGLREARAQAAAIASRLEQDFPATNRGLGADVLPYSRAIFGPEIYGMLYTMLAAGIGVLLVACVNVSNLLLARASLRQREVAVRMALGAARHEVLRQQLTEVLVLAGFGGVLGLLLSTAGMRWFTYAVSINPPPFWMTFDLDYRMMGFVAALIGLATVVAGALPAMQAIRVSPVVALRNESRSSTSACLGRFSYGLVIAELAVSCGLLIAAGLMF
jgi:predicted permease